MPLQLMQNAPDRVVIRVIAKPGFSQSDQNRLVANFRKKIPFTLNIAVQMTDSRETSARGKAPYIIRRLDEPVSVQPASHATK